MTSSKPLKYLATLLCSLLPTLAVSHDAVQDLLLSVPRAEKIREWSHYYTNASHLPGQGLEQGQWTKDLWEGFGIETNLTTHEVNLTYPGDHRVALLDLSHKDHLILEARRIEDTAPGAGQGLKPFIPSFFAWAGVGNVTAQYIFANFGLREDYDDLIKAHVTVRGRIAVVKTVFGSSLLRQLHMGVHRQEQMKAAEEYGLAGLIVYTDPQLDGEITEANGYAAFPEGPARPSSMIERGVITFAGSTSTVPAMPISFADAIPILRALNGYGPSATEFGERWQGGGLGYKNVQYNVGPSPSNIVLNICNKPTFTDGHVHHVIGTIPGSTFPDEVIMLGTHRDSWGPGAGDGSSGSSALNEVARSFGTALTQGWQPSRTIMIASFEGLEFSLPGTKDWWEQNQWLNDSAFAYLDVVSAGAGSKFHVQGSPLLGRAMRYGAGLVLDPNTKAKNQTMLDVWGGEVSLGTGGDGSILLGTALLSSVDFGFSAGEGDTPFPYHSLYDTDEWMDRYGDPNRDYHLTTTKIWSLAVFALASDVLLPVTVNEYAVLLQGSLKSVNMPGLDLSSMERAIRDLNQATLAFDAYADYLGSQISAHPDEPKLLSKAGEVNHRYIEIERLFADPHPQPGSSHHLIIPRVPYYFQSSAFPALQQSIAAGNLSAAEVSHFRYCVCLY
ncbi:hypothetical protein BDV37DRAFT_242419 [Aspergillus pseudonomiae]|uniref:Glutamate carboxypeptidase n=1 Tax=Aspergillus pseudonomiae TaxID=1506151 RepID=A0A5N7DK96_9EURO|nr:uncharacterized protein BDV37DRAFT_242419 [Aspergillus pseudonomiae]KAE8406705.1 hypothetical protein BDV37DRAFT_242419 [Aspergillus pseudonomiae]